MSETCPPVGSLVDVELGRLTTPYREAYRFRGYVKAVLDQIEQIALATCVIPSFFDLSTALGEQLTFIGKRMGFPRCHCACSARPVFGFECAENPSLYPVVGFCEDGDWLGCDGNSDLCLTDDEVYRAHLLARRYQILGLYDLESLSAALRHVWGAAAWVPQAKGGKVVVSPGRNFTAAEVQRLAITLRILPVAPGIQIAVHFGSSPIFGFGTGWGGFCAEPAALWLCPTPIDPYACS